MPERFRTVLFALSALLFAVQAASARAQPPSDVISTSGRGGNIVADARMWWSNPTGHSDAFRTQTSNCLDLLDQAEQHRLVAMRHYDQARAKGPLPGSERSRLQRMGNDEYAIVTRLVRQFYECARVQPDRRTARTQAPSDQFGTGSGGRPPPGSDRISTGRTDSGPPRAADAERLCDMQRLALLVSERYARPGLPIATYRLRNVGNLAVRRDRPTYLVVAQGVSDTGFWTYWLEQAARSYSSSSPSPEARLLGALTEQAIGDSYEKAILAAIASLPAGANLVLAGHSLGGMELQRLVSTLRQRGHFVPYVATFGSPIVDALSPGTLYSFVKADGDIIAHADQIVGGNSSLVRIPGGNVNPLDTRGGSHHIYFRSPALNGLDALGNRRTVSSPCLEIDIRTRMEYAAPGLRAVTRAERPANVHVDCPNCFWVALEQDDRWAAPHEPRHPAPKVTEGIAPIDVVPILRDTYGARRPVPPDLDAERAGAFRAGVPVESSATVIENELRAAGPGHRGLIFSSSASGSHVINVRSIADPSHPGQTRVIYWDAQIVDPAGRNPATSTPPRSLYLGPTSTVHFYRTH